MVLMQGKKRKGTLHELAVITRLLDKRMSLPSPSCCTPCSWNRDSWRMERYAMKRAIQSQVRRCHCRDLALTWQSASAGTSMRSCRLLRRMRMGAGLQAS